MVLSPGASKAGYLPLQLEEFIVSRLSLSPAPITPWLAVPTPGGGGRLLDLNVSLPTTV